MPMGESAVSFSKMTVALKNLQHDSTSCVCSDSWGLCSSLHFNRLLFAAVLREPPFLTLMI